MASKDIQTKLSIKQRNYFSKRHHGKSKDFAPKIAVPENFLETGFGKPAPADLPT